MFPRSVTWAFCVLAAFSGASFAQEKKPSILVKGSQPETTEAPIKAVSVSNSKPAGNAVTAGSGYTLRYKLQASTKIESRVTHLAKTNTKINDVEQISQSRTVSQKVWTVTKVEPNGNMTFVHQVDSVDMAQQVGDEKELTYNSKTDEIPLEVFKKVADTLGKPLATVTITPSGQVVGRSDEATGANLGMGDITIPLPTDAVQIGAKWETSREIRIRREDGTPKNVKVRELYTLEKVGSGVATISIRSEPLTPLKEPEMEAQALQQMSNGEIRFDIDAGRLISKSLTWDKTVVGFSGPNSVMDYSARLEEIVE